MELTLNGIIKLKVFNIFVESLKSGATSPVIYVSIEDWGVGYGDESADHGGSIMLEVNNYLHTGDIDTHSVSGNGGDVSITAADAIIGTIMPVVRLIQYGDIPTVSRLSRLMLIPFPSRV